MSAAPATPASHAAPDVYRQLGQITRQLHDTLTELGVMPNLQRAASCLPDARSRLSYVAQKTGAAAERVLDAVERAKAEHAGMAVTARRLAQSAGDVVSLGEIEAASTRLDAHLTEIMLAQDFHDLTGQVVSKVVRLAGDLEDSLVALLVQAAPSVEVTAALAGPVIDAQGRPDSVANQGEVDDLLASLGF